MTQDHKDPVHLHATTDEAATSGDGGCPRPAGSAKFSGFTWIPPEGPSWTDRENWSALARCDTPAGNTGDTQAAG